MLWNGWRAYQIRVLAPSNEGWEIQDVFEYDMRVPICHVQEQLEYVNAFLQEGWENGDRTHMSHTPWTTYKVEVQATWPGIEINELDKCRPWRPPNNEERATVERIKKTFFYTTRIPRESLGQCMMAAVEYLGNSYTVDSFFLRDGLERRN